MPLVLVRLDSLISSFLGETAANLRKVFDYVASQPVVALFDEFDALTKDRGDSADHGELKRSVNAVLQMMDGYRGESILIATTNYESLLDKAVWRRFDEVLRFELPSLEQIKRLLSLKLSGIRRNFEAGRRPSCLAVQRNVPCRHRARTAPGREGDDPFGARIP
jgi:SpoVK/Ycf46/Vps4 family AAA+-type ATPase